MKTHGLYIFLTIFLTVYIIIHFLILKWGKRLLTGHATGYRIWAVFIITGALLYPAGRIVTGVFPGLPGGLMLTGSLWLGFLAYISIIALSYQCLSGLVHVISSIGYQMRLPEGRKVIFSSVMISIIILTAGYISAGHIAIRHMDININKSSSSVSDLRIVHVSDMHLGSIIQNSHLEELVSLINSQNPDLVLFTGDIVDEGCGPVITNRMGDELLKIRSRYGIFAVTGNHEYIGGAEEAVSCFSGYGIHFLRDSFIKVAGVCLAGREDLSIKRFTGRKRLSLKKIISQVELNMPIILMDHQPFNIAEARENNVDLFLSGHTHNGQLWPFNYIVEMIYPIAYGYAMSGNTQVYVSAGCGTWGPPIRTSSRPEIITFDIKFKRVLSGKVNTGN